MILHNHLLNLLVGKGQRSQDEKSLEIWAIQPVQEMPVNSSGHKWPRDNWLKKTAYTLLGIIHSTPQKANMKPEQHDFQFRNLFLQESLFTFVVSCLLISFCFLWEKPANKRLMAWHTQRSVAWLITLHYPSAETSRHLGIWVLTPLKLNYCTQMLLYQSGSQQRCKLCAHSN